MTPNEFFNTVRDSLEPRFHCTAHSGLITHTELHANGIKSHFELKASARHIAFSLDKPGLNPFDILAPGLNSRNDLTVCCLSPKGIPLVFVIECKNSVRPGDAQHQISCGMEFCKYLFSLLRFKHGIRVEPKYFGVAAYRPKSPPKGLTRPRFIRQGGNDGLMRAEWLVDVVLPLSELIRATNIE